MNRVSLKDVWWQPFMVDGAEFGDFDIPFCPNTSTELPKEIITYEEAKKLYKKQLRKKDMSFKSEAYVCFYEDDYVFDSIYGIWFRPKKAHEILSHFAGIITPDFSTYCDFPEPLLMWQTYRMRAFGYWYGTICGGKVINNVRWGDENTWEYCFNGLPTNDVLAIGTVGGSPYKKEDRERFETGLNELVKRLQPHTIIVYGSANYPCFKKLQESGINIVAYKSRMNKKFEKIVKERAKSNE